MGLVPRYLNGEDYLCSGPFKCKKYDCKTGTFVYGCLEVSDTDDPTIVKHAINTNISMTACGVDIPLLKTVRTHQHKWAKQYERPRTVIYDPASAAISAGAYGPWRGCDWIDEGYTSSISEDCVIEKCTLAYLDHTAQIMLYKYVKEEVHFTEASTEYAAFRDTYGDIWRCAKIKIPLYSADSGQSHAYGTEEWRLVVEGSTQTLTHETYNIAAMPWIGPLNINGVDACMEIPEQKYLIFLFPEPPSMFRPLDQDIICNGYYAYFNNQSDLNYADGGYMDMFYPEWCRNLQSDPLWQDAAARRVASSMFITDLKYDLQETLAYRPDADTIPRGNAAVSDKLGTYYQFLVEQRNNATKIAKSHDLTEMLDKVLPDGHKTHDTTLYYPFSLI